jgi:hypothetical protein
MERCSYCGEPVGEAPIEVQGEAFCSEDCLERFNTGEGEDEDYYSADDFNSDDYEYRDY